MIYVARARYHFSNLLTVVARECQCDYTPSIVILHYLNRVRLHMISYCFNHHMLIANWETEWVIDNFWSHVSASVFPENHFADTVSRFPCLFKLETGKSGSSAETLLFSLQETIMGDYLKTNLAAEHINACVQASWRWGWNSITF